MGNKQFVIAFFENEEAADEAVDKIKKWDKGRADVEMDNIGVLVKDDKGKIKTHKLGKRKTGTGAVLGALAGVLSGGLTVVGGALLGGVIGAFFHKGLGMSKDDLTRIDGDLDGGRAAVGILAKADEADAVADKLAELGGEAGVGRGQLGLLLPQAAGVFKRVDGARVIGVRRSQEQVVKTVAIHISGCAYRPAELSPYLVAVFGPSRWRRQPRHATLVDKNHAFFSLTVVPSRRAHDDVAIAIPVDIAGGPHRPAELGVHFVGEFIPSRGGVQASIFSMIDPCPTFKSLPTIPTRCTDDYIRIAIRVDVTCSPHRKTEQGLRFIADFRPTCRLV